MVFSRVQGSCREVEEVCQDGKQLTGLYIVIGTSVSFKAGETASQGDILVDLKCNLIYFKFLLSKLQEVTRMSLLVTA